MATQNPFQSVQQFVGSAFQAGENAINPIVGKVKQDVSDFFTDTGFGKALRSSNLLTGAQPQGISFEEANWGTSNNLDWRVRLSVPESFKDSPLMQPLVAQTNGLVWPYTPQVMIEQSASYSAMTPVHSNYPYYSYQNSQVSAINVMGEYFIENALEGEYWVAAIHYLRSVTKMAYGGNTSNQGSPPPVVRLNGYGDYVFKNVPVIVQSFTVELPSDVDYIQVGLGANGNWVPTRSTINVSMTPIYSRRATTEFNLDAFVRGDYVINGKGYL